MFSATRSEDATLSRLDESSEEESDYEMSDTDCQVCWNLRLPYPEFINTTYEELEDAGVDGCELCDLLRRISEAACVNANALVRDAWNITVSPKVIGEHGDPAYLVVEWDPEEGERSSTRKCTFWESLPRHQVHCTAYIDGSAWRTVSFYLSLGKGCVVHGNFEAITMITYS
jgi:hypothetical protein